MYHTLEIKTIWLIIVSKYIQQAIVTDDQSSVNVDITIIDLDLLKLLVKISNTYVKLHKTFFTTLHMFILCATILTGRHLKCMRNDRLWAFNIPQNTYYITVFFCPHTDKHLAVLSKHTFDTQSIHIFGLVYYLYQNRPQGLRIDHWIVWWRPTD
jgi:hypothetical protein